VLSSSSCSICTPPVMGIERPTCVSRACDCLEAQVSSPSSSRILFAVRGDPGFFLIPTAEVPVTNLVRDQISHPTSCR